MALPEGARALVSAEKELSRAALQKPARRPQRPFFAQVRDGMEIAAVKGLDSHAGHGGDPESALGPA